MRTLMLRTLATKHRSSVSKMTARHKAKIETPHGPRTCFEATAQRQGRKPLVARFGGIPLKRNKNTVLFDRAPDPTPHRHREVVQRLLRSVCEICKQPDDIHVHQVETCRPQRERENRPTRMDEPHEQQTPEDPDGLPVLP
jgi:hypothetical protein